MSLNVLNPTGGTLPIYGAIVATTLPPGMSIAQPTSGALQIMGAAVLGALDENGIFVPVSGGNAYLPLTGGTMSGGISFGGGSAVSIPEDLSRCFHFYDGNVELGMSVTANTLNFVATQADDGFNFRVASTTVARVGNFGMELFGSTFLKTSKLFVAGVEISGVPATGNTLIAESPTKAVWGSPAASGATIPSTLNLLIGDGAGNAADSGILPSALVKNQGGNIDSTVGVNADMMAQITNTINNVLPGMVDAAVEPAIAAAFNDGSNLNKLMDAAGIVTIGNVITPPGASLQTHNGWIRSVV